MDLNIGLKYESSVSGLDFLQPICDARSSRAASVGVLIISAPGASSVICFLYSFFLALLLCIGNLLPQP